MKIIFLDFDGVITIPPKWHFDNAKIKYIKKIVDETNAKIVVSSSWRRKTIDETIEKIKKWNYKYTKSKLFDWFINNLYDVTPWISDNKYSGTGRGGEIQTWLDNHPNVDNYVIIDDDSDMLDSQLYHFVETNYEDGITEVEAHRAIKILNKVKIINSMAINFELRYQYLLKINKLPNKYDELKKYDMNDLY